MGEAWYTWYSGGSGSGNTVLHCTVLRYWTVIIVVVRYLLGGEVVGSSAVLILTNELGTILYSILFSTTAAAGHAQRHARARQTQRLSCHNAARIPRALALARLPSPSLQPSTPRLGASHPPAAGSAVSSVVLQLKAPPAGRPSLRGAGFGVRMDFCLGRTRQGLCCDGVGGEMVGTSISGDA